MSQSAWHVNVAFFSSFCNLQANAEELLIQLVLNVLRHLNGNPCACSHSQKDIMLPGNVKYKLSMVGVATYYSC